MEKSENINELAKALSSAQGVMLPAVKDSNNPFFKSKYADLAAVWSVAREPLYKNGLSLTQFPTTEGNIVTIETILAHSSGQWMSSKLTMTAKDSSPQAIGSCITYARRYSLSSVLGIASEEDDDGNAATHKTSHFQTPANAPNIPNKAFIDPSEDKVTAEQGKAILTLAKANGWETKDIKEMILFELDLHQLSDIQNKHLIRIKEYFSKPKTVSIPAVEGV